MANQVIDAINMLVKEIYSLEQTQVDQKFLNLVDSMDKFIQEMAQQGYYVELTQELNAIQESYIKKDYVQLSDYLLYEVKPQFDELIK